MILVRIIRGCDAAELFVVIRSLPDSRPQVVSILGPEIYRQSNSYDLRILENSVARAHFIFVGGWQPPPYSANRDLFSRTKKISFKQ